MADQERASNDRSSPVERHSPYRSDATQPIDEDQSDPFGHRDYADAIEGALDEVPSQFTLGLFGPWGSGKSTILVELSRRLNSPEKKGAALAIFDAWRYGGDSLRREFVREVGEQLKAHGALPRRFKVKKHIESFSVDVTRPRETLPSLSLASFISAALAALFVAAVIAGIYGLYTLTNLDDETAVKVEIAVLGPIVAFVLVVAGRLISPVQVQQSRRRFEFPEQFSENFRGLLDKVRAERVVIAIDNLDRCSPKRVAEVLSTIKTFLEPALEGGDNPGAKSLCFIIAADDEALRRHLIAEEVEQIAPALDQERAVGGEDPAKAARDAVDEYLRKFFNASIRITEMLDDDMRQFTQREMRDFFTWHEEIDPKVEARLIELTAQGLKRNPRRIKQFVNNLELRLQLFSERRRAKHILIDPEVMVVAKLAILEEEFPDEYQLLRRDPGLLARWHRRAESEQPNEENEEETPRVLSQELIGFLRFSNNIEPPDIAPYLTLKQSRDELQLPGYREFVDQLDEANSRGLTEMLSGADERLLARHRGATRSHFERQIMAHAWSRAHNTARAVVETPELHGPDGELVAHVIDRSLSNREVRLVELDPQLLLAAAKQNLSGSRFADLLDAELEAISGPDAPTERRNIVGEALGGIAEELDDEARRRLRRGFEDRELRQSFDAYAELAQALPEVVAPEAVDEALDRLGEEEIFDATDSRFQVAVAGLRQPRARPSWANRLVELTRPSLIHHRNGEEGIRFVELGEAIVPTLALANDDGVLSGLAGELNEGWEATPSDARGVALDLARVALGSSTQADSEHGQALGARIFGLEAGEAEEWIAENVGELAPGFKAGVTNRLRAGLAGEGEDVALYLRCAGALEAAEQVVLFRDAAREAVELKRYPVAEQLFASLGKEEADSIMASVATSVEESPGQALEADQAAVKFVVEQQKRLNAEQLDRIATALIGALVPRRELAPEMGPMIGMLRIEDAASRLGHVNTLIAFDQEVSDLSRREGILRAANGIAGKRPSKARKTIDMHLDSVSDAGPDLAEMVKRIRAG